MAVGATLTDYCIVRRNKSAFRFSAGRTLLFLRSEAEFSLVSVFSAAAQA
ncbi:hypothetical protein BN1012_Phect904 [Candidatus Phaeomarinobacter ectocarpi]|uniref:Uncharacterized protein n=1 Tax=Candidatus Phaeomarinibacter ectocarpi TaxID=1458461 RepID=X5M7I0_9HYPH|nr:hypothetical protein BN1012_Phect904 [Candidatus Phaeomarinobacter ectocarpi]